MNRNYTICIGILLLLLTLLVIWFWPSEQPLQGITKTELSIPSQQSTPTPSSSGFSQPDRPPTKKQVEPIQKEQEQRQKVVAQVEAMLNTSITFYGKVVDQNDNLVPNAYIGYSLLDKFDASGSNDHLNADETGYFEISGVKGAVLGVNVRKEGYYQIHNVSNQRFSYGISPDTYTKPPPSKDKPAVFVLQKMGKTEPLIFLGSRQVEVPITKNLTQVDLTTGRIGQGDLHIKSQFKAQAQNRYDWSFTLSVPGGGLIERSGSFDFEAPKEGYKDSVEVGMLASDPKWKSSTAKSYFIKLSNGTFSRIEVRFYPSDYRNMIVMESLLNPIPGSRNLEYDPAKRINP